jgi:plastocyanin
LLISAFMATKYRLMLAVAAFVVTTSCSGGGYSSPTTPSTASGTQVTIPRGAQSMGSAAYAPNPVTISAGSSVTWMNTDTVTHTATSDSGAFSGNLAPGATYSYTFPAKGTYPYHCTQHPGMMGTVVVQ